MKTIIMTGLAIVTVAILAGIPDAASIGSIYQIYQTDFASPVNEAKSNRSVQISVLKPLPQDGTTVATMGGGVSMSSEYRREQRAVLNPARLDDLSNRRYQIQVAQGNGEGPNPSLAERIRALGYRVVQAREPHQAVTQLLIDGFRSREDADRAVYLLRRQMADTRFIIAPVASL
ncbi:MAG: hypothetical protein HQL60_05705 [Magnetococcales bacterium]|nr:hypothetical protein [Magnetococcales bacterium]